MKLVRRWAVWGLVACAAAAAGGAGPATRPTPDLSGTWLADVVDTPATASRSKLVLTDHTFALSGYRGIAAAWTGTFALGAGGDGNLDLRSDPFDATRPGGPPRVYPAAAVRGLYRLTPSPDGDRLAVCFTIRRDGPRPAGLIEGGDRYTQRVTFGRVDPAFTVPTTVTVTVRDPQGRPAAGASLFSYAEFDHAYRDASGGRGWVADEASAVTWRYTEVARAGPDGTVRLPSATFGDADGAPCGAHDAAHHWTGFATTSPFALRHGTVTFQMQAERILRGTITSDPLTRAGRPVPWRAAYLHVDGNRPLWHDASDGAYAFPVPPGTYTLDAYGTDLYPQSQRVTVPPGEGDVVLPAVSLEPSLAVPLAGRVAPPLDGVARWKNGPVTLEQLRGRVVLLDFWGYWCGPCVRGMPELMRLNAKYGGRGLTVVGVHVDAAGDHVDTAAELDVKTAGWRRDLWGGRDLPFPTALVSGGAAGGSRVEAAYGIVGFPAQVLIGRDGKVVEGPTSLGDDPRANDACVERLLAAR